LKFYCKFYFIFFYCVTCLITGCSTIILPPKNLSTLQHPKVRNHNTGPLSRFTAVGKVGFSDGKTGGNASITWIQQNTNFQISLYGPLGSGSVKIIGDPTHIILTQSNGKSTTAKNPEELLRSQLGLVIPISGLPFWIRGIPAPGIPPRQLQIDDKQRIWEIKQQGWRISYQAYGSQHGIEFPCKFVLKHGAIQLKFIFQHWHLLPP
jgi:outer membrane lipoprotein LolB